jgi:hypothetical protein
MDTLAAKGDSPLHHYRRALRSWRQTMSAIRKILALATD